MLARRALERLGRELWEAGGVSRGPMAGPDARRDRERRRRSGAYFTPAPLVDFVVAETLGAAIRDPALGWRDDGSPRLRVLDPCAGDGRFLASVVRFLARWAERRGHPRERARAAIIRRCVVGLERDREFAAAARARLGEGARIHCCEALLDAPDEVGGVDAVVGNPPYIRSIRLARADQALWTALRGRYAATSHGEWDLYAAFIEQALGWIRPGGEVGLVVPSRWLTARFATRLRGALADAAAVRGVVDFGAAQVFPDATTYAAVIFLSRSPRRQVAVARYADGAWQRGRIASTSLSAGPWRLSLGAQRGLVERLSNRGPTLGQVARIVKGAGTNADGVYVLTAAELHGDEVRGRCRAAASEAAPAAIVRVEAAACRPCLRGRDVTSYGRVPGAVQCIVPYHRDGTSWSPRDLAAFPLAAGHLARFRALLEARERGRFAGEHYYRFGRPQNMAFLGDPAAKIVIPDVARHGRALLDRDGAMVLDSAYAIRPTPDGCSAGYTVPLLLAVCNSPVVAWWLRETGVPLRGGYLRLKTAYLASLPLPPPGPATADAATLAACADGRHPVTENQRHAIVEALRQAYGVEPGEWRDLVSQGGRD